MRSLKKDVGLDVRATTNRGVLSVIYWWLQWDAELFALKMLRVFPLSIFAALFFAQSALSFALTALFFPQAERHLIRASYTYIWMHTDLHLILILSLTKVYVLTWGVALLSKEQSSQCKGQCRIEQRTEQQNIDSGNNGAFQSKELCISLYS